MYAMLLNSTKCACGAKSTHQFWISEVCYWFYPTHFKYTSSSRHDNECMNATSLLINTHH